MLKRVSGILIIVISILIFLYPTISGIYNEYVASRMISKYTDNLVNIEDYETEIREAEEYNSRLTKNTCLITAGNSKKEATYEGLLDASGNGVMGYLQIPKISQKLPIYHYSDEESLENGIGHLHGSSLPVGGKGTNCVLTGHRGLPGNMMLTRMDEIEAGDQISICVYDMTLVYEVTDIRTVLPDETDGIVIDPEKDQITIVTCTPYGINSHRLIVTAERIEVSDSEVEEVTETQMIMKGAPLTRVYIVIAGLAVVILVRIVRGRKKGRRDDRKEVRNKGRKENIPD